ncbi:MAG: double-strand break repair helicase AddA, partial [Alphaproteobacteria bacterium]
MTNIQSLKQKIGVDATALQNTASNPAHNVWVGASAGTGKTKVLTDRVLRLLLPTTGENDGTDPSKILCITFTKAGASEMITRVMSVLSHWAVCDENILNDALEKLLGGTPSSKQHDKARRLFAQVVDMPEGLKITTIHAFCQSILGRFPLEAHLSPQFKLIEEGEAANLIHQARNALIQDIRAGQTSDDLRGAFYNLAGWKNGEEINKLIQSALRDREKIKSLKNSKDALNQYLGLSPDDTYERVLSDFFGNDFPQETIQKLALALSHGAVKNQGKSKFLSAFLKLSITEKIGQFNAYKSAFLKDKDQFYADSHVSNSAKAFDEYAPQIFTDEAIRVKNISEKIKSILIAQSTQSLLFIARDIIARYEHLKSLQSALDYDDLINATRDLLCSKTQNGLSMTDWILFKLDGGIDHILVDEAQDTSREQWDIILKLSEEFFTGLGARDADKVNRTIFIVGDEKQSIYRFNGADPKSFARVKSEIQTRVTHAQKSFQDVPMNTSFRSVRAILDTVDAIFNHDDVRGAIAENVQHTAYRQGQSGRVEIWPPYQTPPLPARQPWKMPTEIQPSFDAKAALANRIADQIATWITNGELLTAHNRPIAAGDIMILVRRRNAFVDHLIRALKSKNIPVSGVDRMVVSSQIAVQDILAILNFALMPDDDLTLATILKSPFIGWDDRTLEEYAFPREKTLWEEIKSRAPDTITAWLSTLIETLNNGSVFEAANTILIQKTPNNNKTGWQAILSRLGIDAIDAVEEFLSQAQDYDFQNPSLGLQGFLHAMHNDKRALKREMATTSSMVKIMTVHASKGLQAPIVFLPDTCAMPKPAGASNNGFIWHDDETPLWVKSSDDVNEAYKSKSDAITAEDRDEYYRLLYVAMTRAEDLLIIGGYLSARVKSAPKGCWYDVIENALPSLSMTKNDWDFDETLVLENVKQSIETLPEKYKLVLMLYLYEGYDHNEVSEILNI